MHTLCKVVVLCALSTASVAHAQIDRFSPARTVAVSGADPAGDLFGETKTTVPIPGTTQISPYYGDLNESVEGFGTSASNTLAAFADQQSTIAPTLEELGGSPVLLRGSASLSARFDQAGEFEGRAFSRIQWEFTVDSETTVQITWALAAISTGPDAPSRFLNRTTFSLGDGTSQGVFFSQSAALGQMNEGGDLLTFGPGIYTLYLSADVDFMPDTGDFGFPADITRTAEYSVTLAVVPAPASAILLAGFSLVAARRRR